MLPEEIREDLQRQITAIEHPRELAVDVMFALQAHYGYLSDTALEEAASLLGMTPLELEELATSSPLSTVNRWGDTSFTFATA